MRLVSKCTDKALQRGCLYLLSRDFYQDELISNKFWIKYNIMAKKLNLDDVFYNFFNWNNDLSSPVTSSIPCSSSFFLFQLLRSIFQHFKCEKDWQFTGTSQKLIVNSPQKEFGFTWSAKNASETPPEDVLGLTRTAYCLTI